MAPGIAVDNEFFFVDAWVLTPMLDLVGREN